MYKHIWIAFGAAALLLFASSAQAGDQAAGPIPRGSQNHLGRFSCDVYFGYFNDTETITVQMSSAPVAGGPSSVVATQTFPDVPSGETRTLVVTGVPFGQEVTCVVDQQRGAKVTLSSLLWWNDSLETVIGAPASTAIIDLP